MSAPPRRLRSAVWLGAAVLLVVGVVAFALAFAHGDGIDHFYRAADPGFFRSVGQSPFGDGTHFLHDIGRSDASYRYGRIGLPLVGWALAGGQSGAVGVTIALVNLVAIAAVVTLAGVYLGRLGRDPLLGALVLFTPGLLLLIDRPYAEPLAVALVLGALVFDTTGRTGWALVALAAAICTRETVALAVVPFVGRDVRAEGVRGARWLLAVVPYLAWATWVRVRVGEFPFLARTPLRGDALRPPFVGYAQALHTHTPQARLTVVVALMTAVLAVAFGWWTRSAMAGGVAMASAILAVCLGPNALRYVGETLRLLVFPQVFVLVCAGFVFGERSAPVAVPNAGATTPP